MTIEAVDPRARGLRTRPRDEAVGLVGLIARLDWVLLGAMLATLAYGIWAIDGITKHDPGGSAASRQALYAGAGLVLFVIAILIDPVFYRRIWRAIYIGLCGVMTVVLVFGAATRGSKRWIDIGFFTFQPSEFGKVLLALCLAGYVAGRSKQVDSLAVPLKTIALAAGPVLLVFLQPDAGTALVYIAVLAAVLFVSGARWLHLALIGGVALVAILGVLWFLPAAGVNVLKPYQAARLTGFTHPSTDPTDSTSYNLAQSKIAVGSGGLRGRGVAGATQTALDYLPAHPTDFAFASLGEQRGFLGASLLLLLYLLIVWRGLKIVTTARDFFSAIVAAGIVFAFLFQVFVNVGMTIGIAPITGIPLPFVSVGGSSMISNLLGIGILEAIYVRGGEAPVKKSTLTPLSLVRVAREVRQTPGAGLPLAIGGARELVPMLAKELRAGGDPSAVRENGISGGVAALVWLGAPDEDLLRRASRAGVPIVGVTEGERLPYVLDTNLVQIPPGQGLPVAGIVEALGRALGPRGTGLAARLPVLRPGVVDELIRAAARRNGLIGAAVFVPGVDLPVLTLNQLLLVMRIANAHGRPVDSSRLPEALAVVGAGYGFRTIARQALDLLPVAGWALKGGIAYGGTRAVGEAARKRFS